MSEHVEGRFTAYHDGALAPAETERIRFHLETCASCREAYEDHVRLEALLERATATPERSASMWPDVSARLHPRRPFRLTFGLAGGMAFAAAAGIALSVALPARTPTAAVETNLWDALGYGLVDGAPAALAAFETGGDE
ncbi:zf-HC2 domain-containing protein [bacterium]|nr:zf-HC2 domain-containing protein [bacterium]